jgi:hypothetical protein
MDMETRPDFRDLAQGRELLAAKIMVPDLFVQYIIRIFFIGIDYGSPST